MLKKKKKKENNGNKDTMCNKAERNRAAISCVWKLKNKWKKKTKKNIEFLLAFIFLITGSFCLLKVI